VISSLAIRVVTVVVFFVGFAFGWWWRGRRNRELAAELFEACRRENDWDLLRARCKRRSLRGQLAGNCWRWWRGRLWRLC
jgi:hypothetical protein